MRTKDPSIKPVKVFAGDQIITVGNGRISHKRESVALAGAQARVESAGDIDRRVTATRLLLTGPFAFGLRKKKDNRELYLTIEGGDGTMLLDIKAKHGKRAREAAAQINNFARAAAPVAHVQVSQPRLNSSTSTSTGSRSVIDQLERLGRLRDQGILNAAEFEAQKAKLLS